MNLKDINFTYFLIITQDYESLPVIVSDTCEYIWLVEVVENMLTKAIFKANSCQGTNKRIYL